jgi:hypothetical protein
MIGDGVDEAVHRPTMKVVATMTRPRLTAWSGYLTACCLWETLAIWRKSRVVTRRTERFEVLIRASEKPGAGFVDDDAFD